MSPTKTTRTVAASPAPDVPLPIFRPPPSIRLEVAKFFDSLPDHTQLPESDGTFVKNFQEHPQSVLLTTSISPVLNQLHPDGQFAIGQDCGIYWKQANPPQEGAEAPDWFYVPNVPPLLDGKVRGSYVLWKEYVSPVIVLEFVSGNGKEERDRTPSKGKFWVYEHEICPKYYGIYEVKKARVEVYELVRGRYQRIQPNARGHYPIPPMGVELGIWQGTYANAELPWLRWWDIDGNLLLDGDERAEQEAYRAEQEAQRANTEAIARQEAEDEAAQLRAELARLREQIGL